MKIGILRETKKPKDCRVPFSPLQCRQLQEVEFCIQPDGERCFSNSEYWIQGIPLQEKLNDCDYLFGIKEVDTETLIDGKTYVIFSHTGKKQKHNRKLLKAILDKKIRLIDYEYLTDENNSRIVAFGYWAGFVGAYNSLIAYGLRTDSFSLKPAWQCKNKDEVLAILKEIPTPGLKIVITGGGRVASGAMEVLNFAGFKGISPQEFIKTERGSFYTQLDPVHYVKHNNSKKFDLQHFYANPQEYENAFLPFTSAADMFLACHFWDPRSPKLMKREDMLNPEFRIKIIGDISCDIEGPIPSTLRASSIKEPFYGFDPSSGKEVFPFDKRYITVMSVDNLPGELPCDASEDFGKKLSEKIIPLLLKAQNSPIIKRATIAENGKLCSDFSYLQDFADEE